MLTILIADDDPKLTDMLRRTLTYEGYCVMTAADGQEALAQGQAQQPDLVVLDWMMPRLSGLEVARRLRAAQARVPILMLTARDAVVDRVEGLDSGADDYLVKPFVPAELLARVRALLRRAPDLGEKPLRYRDLLVDLQARETRRGDRALALSPKEFDLLSFLLRHPRQVLPRSRILEEVWGYDFGGEDSVLDVYIGYLRAKTEANGEPRLIQTVRGIGYVIREP
jgi:two-component system response regulator MprA